MMKESKLKDSIMLRMLLTVWLALLLLIPAYMIESIINERSHRKT